MRDPVVKSRRIVALFTFAAAVLLLLSVPFRAQAGDPRKPLPPSPGGIPPAPQGKDSFRFVVISDSNASYGSIEQGPAVKKAVETVIALKPEFVCHAGDLIAGQQKGIPREKLIQMWGGYHKAVTEPLKAAGIPLAPSPGNHDASIQPDRDVYGEEWRKADLIPKLDFVEKSKWPYYYSFRWKNVLVLSLDAALTSMDGGQLGWMKGQLGAARGMALRFTVGHIPPSVLVTKEYGAKGHGTISPGDRIVAAMLEGGVNAAFFGHYHVYYKARLNGLNFVGTGIIGTGQRRLEGEANTQPNSFIVVDVVKGEIAQCFALKGPSFRDIMNDADLPASSGEYKRFDQK